MPRIAAGSIVEFRPAVVAELRYPPLGGGTLAVAVETAALKSKWNALTTVIMQDGNDIVWVASLDESMLDVLEGTIADTRIHLTNLVLKGDALWQVMRPGTLRLPGTFRNDTVYQGDRPWVVVGGPHRSGVLAVPLNDLGEGTRGHYQCRVGAEHLLFPGSINSKLELNHSGHFHRTFQSPGTLSRTLGKAWPED